MDSKKWGALLFAAERGSLSKAADELGYTQSGMTYLINSLEEECGVPLLLRSWDGVRLSPEGEALRGDVNALLAAEAQLRRHVAELSGAQEKRLCIGTFASISTQWLAKVLGRFQEKFPDTELDLRVGARQELRLWLQNGDVDLVFADRLEVPSTSWTEMYVDPLLAVLPKNHPAAHKAVFSAEDAGGLPFFMPPDSNTEGNLLRMQFAHQANVRMRTEDDTVMLSLIAQGVGFSILPELALRGHAENVALLPLAEPLYRRLGMNRPAGVPEGHALHTLLSLLRADSPAPANYPLKK